jgi:hypothetical protein
MVDEIAGVEDSTGDERAGRVDTVTDEVNDARLSVSDEDTTTWSVEMDHSAS